MAVNDRKRELEKDETPSCCGKPMHWQPAGLCWHCPTCYRSRSIEPLLSFPDEKK